ncbi:MAG TPA: hypothetical protein VKA05_07355 [Acidimicrobiales bacterium]|nr:hypothetical protein [Acidimicrobiales bacterium]
MTKPEVAPPDPARTTELVRLWHPTVERFAETGDQWGRYSRVVTAQVVDSSAESE